MMRCHDIGDHVGAIGVSTLVILRSWLAFGILKREWPLVLSNAICLALSGFILAMKVLPASSRKKVAGSLGG